MSQRVVEQVAQEESDQQRVAAREAGERVEPRQREQRLGQPCCAVDAGHQLGQRARPRRVVVRERGDLGQRERFDEVVVGAGVEAADPVVDRRQADRQHRQLGQALVQVLQPFLAPIGAVPIIPNWRSP
ncbi:hypothetical protein [Crenobacter cavernae]|uniref:hypothetical protein n=1 Tax=Crenobacter cavernae TaxID=2290923 RepID=UPI003CCC6C77